MRNVLVIPVSGADEAELWLCSPDFLAGFQSLQESRHFPFVDLRFLFQRLHLLGGVPAERGQHSGLAGWKNEGAPPPRGRWTCPSPLHKVQELLVTNLTDVGAQRGADAFCCHDRPLGELKRGKRCYCSSSQAGQP